MIPFFLAFLLVAACGPPSREVLPASREPIARAAPSLSRNVLDDALDAFDCAWGRGEISRRRVAIIDYTRPSIERRLWLIDLDAAQVVRMLVAHGKNSGELWADSFSNEPETKQSSLGLFRGAEVYEGDHGRSMRLDGLETRVNDQARDRAIVIHGAEYVSYWHVLLKGRLGRSWGCPAVPLEQIDLLIDALSDGGALFAWYPDPQWLSTSEYLSCQP